MNSAPILVLGGAISTRPGDLMQTGATCCGIGHAGQTWHGLLEIERENEAVEREALR